MRKNDFMKEIDEQARKKKMTISKTEKDLENELNEIAKEVVENESKSLH